MSNSAVYVLHLMCVPTQIRPFQSGGEGSIHTVGGQIADEIAEELRQLAEAVYEGYEQVCDGVYTRELAIQADGDWQQKLRIGGEYVWARRVTSADGGDEIFDSTSSILVLRPRDIVEIATDFGHEVFKQKHGSVVGDAEAEVQNAAFELLLNELGSDYETCHCRPWPDLLPEVIVDALRGRNLLTASRAEMTALSAEIITAFEARK